MRRARSSRQGGFIASTELMLVVTVLILGLIVGLQAVRVSVVTELADLGESVGNLSQTYSWSGTSGHHASANGSLWQDNFDTCEDATLGFQSGANSRCVQVCDAIFFGTVTAPSGEDDPALPVNTSP